MKNFKVSYSYPLEHPIKVVINKLNRQGLVGWLFQKYGRNIQPGNLIITERIIELPTLHEWLGKIFSKPEGDILEIGHVASSTSLELASLGFNITGIDLREYPFVHKNLKSFKGDFLTQKFEDKFDCIFSLSTIEHFGFSKRYGGEDDLSNKQDEEAFTKIATLLKSNGHAIISVPYAQNWIEGVWFRVYTRIDLKNKLEKDFRIIEERFYKRTKGNWSPVLDPSADPVLPYDGVALFLLRNK